jgi:hypothetical protein
MKEIPPVYFYIPPSEMPVGGVPDNADSKWSGFIDYMRQPGAGMKPAICSYAWILQTFLHLREVDFPCQITSTLPDAGIIIAQRAALPFYLKPNPKQLIVCVRADFDPHNYAHMHIVQNPEDTKQLENSFFMPHWPQPGLIPRDKNRGDKFENIAFFGVKGRGSLAPELLDTSWEKQLEAMGLHWEIVGEERWHDYSNVDAVLAVRNFKDKNEYRHKPATKLHNAWLAGVAAILGTDSAFRAERQSELDYIEVTSVDEAIAALKRLQTNVQLYQAMRHNAQLRSEKLTNSALATRWKNFITEKVVPAYEQWVNLSSLQRKFWFAKQHLKIKENNLIPNNFYPYDTDLADTNNFDIQDMMLVSSLKMYRQVKSLISK